MAMCILKLKLSCTEVCDCVRIRWRDYWRQSTDVESSSIKDLFYSHAIRRLLQ